MSTALAKLLGASEPWFSINLTELERASGNQSTDVRLTSEIAGKIQSHIRSLELEPALTAGPELYYALMGLVALHDKFLADHIGVKNQSDVADVMPCVVSIVERLNIPKQTWALKHSVAKRLLKSHPPKQTMKLLGYRSIDSMLKREPMGVMYGVIRFLETDKWQKQFMLQYRKLQPSDFESRQIELIQLGGPKWTKLTADYVRSSHHNLIHSKELGSILILPLPVKKLNGLTIMLLTLLLHYINEIRLYAAYLKLKQIEPDFGKIVIRTIGHDDTGHTKMAGQAIHWRVIHRHYGQQKKANHPDIFEPYLQADDLAWRKAEEVLYRLEPAFMYWHGMDYVGVLADGQPISFNLMDNTINYMNNVPYGQHTYHNMRRSLWNELQVRYLSHPSLETQVLKQLDSESRSIGVIAQEMFG